MPLKAADYDLLFVGGGQDFEQEVLLEDLRRCQDCRDQSRRERRQGLSSPSAAATRCWGHYYKTWDGEQCDFTGALDLYTIGCTRAANRQLHVHL